jgi:hypothetical protein
MPNSITIRTEGVSETVNCLTDVRGADSIGLGTGSSEPIGLCDLQKNHALDSSDLCCGTETRCVPKGQMLREVTVLDG